MSRPRLTLLAAVAALLLAAPAADARNVIVKSFDGTPIVAHFFPAPGVQGKAPTIMVGHGWGGSGATNPQSEYAQAGYNVLTWDARGFGGSGGTVMIDHPEFEARDVQALIDYIADQPEAQLDKQGDPRVGMDGPSYGGGIQFITAARDGRSRRDHADDRLELAGDQPQQGQRPQARVGPGAGGSSGSRPRCCRASSARPASRPATRAPSSSASSPRGRRRVASPRPTSSGSTTTAPSTCFRSWTRRR